MKEPNYSHDYLARKAREERERDRDLSETVRKDQRDRGHRLAVARVAIILRTVFGK